MEIIMRSRFTKLITAAMTVVAVVVSFGGAALAQGTMQQQNACAPDVFRLCSSYIPNVGEIVACLRGNETRLSEPCRRVMFSGHAAQDGRERTARLHADEVQ
jgi:hypothetical protein